MTDLEEIKEILPYATTDRQREILQTVLDTGGKMAAARSLGIACSTVRQAVKIVRGKATMRGQNAEHDLVHPLAEGFLLERFTSHYKDGEHKQIWLKGKADAQKQLEMMEAVANSMAAELPKAEPVDRPSDVASDLCNLFPIFDAHVGMLAWGQETGGDDWDLDIAEEVITRTHRQAILSSPPAKRGIVMLGGDLMHFDSMENVTPTSRHIVDADGRYPKIVDVTTRIVRRIVEQTLLMHSEVDLVVMGGNHDISSTHFLRSMFRNLYENETRLTVDECVGQFYALQHGEVGIMGHHGHKLNIGSKGGAQRMALVYLNHPIGKAVKRIYGHNGHLHHRCIVEQPGCILEQHQALCAPDAHASSGGWISDRGMRSITYHTTSGEVASQTIRPYSTAS